MERTDGADRATAWFAPQGHARGGAAIARLGRGSARPDSGRVAAEAGAGCCSACERRPSVAGAAADGSAAEKKSLHAIERDSEENRKRREEFLQRLQTIPPEKLIFLDESGVTTQMTDRKSTRLNSSHLGISYAVFCLKKKNKHQTQLLRSELG